MEWNTHKIGAFATLTYNNENLPKAKETWYRGSVSKLELQKFFKRFRINYEREYGSIPKFAWLAVGEYGSKSKRAHYHFLILGLDPFRIEKITQKSWTLGHTQLSALTPDLAPTLIQYILKHNIREPTHISKLFKTQNSEFQLQSKKPALGHTRLKQFAEPFKRKKFYPSAGLTHYEKWLLEYDPMFQYIQPSEWAGSYKVNKDGNPLGIDVFARETNPAIDNQKGKWHSLDRSALRKLARFVDPHILEDLEYIKNNLPVSDLYEKYLYQQITDSKITYAEFEGSIDFIKAQQTSAKSHRRFMKKKATNYV